MRRLSVLLIIAILAGIAGGCRYAIVEGDPVRAMGLSAMAEGSDLFNVDSPDVSYLDDEPVNMTPPPPSGSPSPSVTPTETPAPTPDPTRMPKVKVTPSPTPTEAPYEEVIIGLHSRDEEGENKVRKAQERLQELGYLDTEPDGVFGSRTLKALKRFQQDQGIEETGVLDADTRSALYPQPEVTTAPEDVLFAEGSNGHDIRLIHNKLRLYGFSCRPASSQFVEDTAEEIMEFQSYAVKYYGTEFDDPAYREALPQEDGLVSTSIFMPEVTETPTASPAPSPTPEATRSEDIFGIPDMPVLEPEATLKPFHATDGVVSENLYYYLLSDRFPVYRETAQRGDAGDEVKRIQRRLRILDYYYNDITGEFDNFTDAALKGFQKVNGLQETGIADPETQRLLFSDGARGAEQVEQPYYIKVSLDEQRVYVYRWVDGDYNQLIKTMICSSGLGGSTPRGIFVSPGHRDSRWHYFVEFNCWAQYAFVITGNILFHSVIYSDKSESSLRYSTLSNLGHKASHGCVRLRVEDARWIYEHCGAGQVIEVY